MKNITIYEKGTAKVLTQDLVNKHYSVYKVNLDSAEIAKIVKVNNNLEVYLQNGEKVVIDDFFIGEKPKEFTIETSDGKHYLLNFLEFDASGTVTKIDYLGITDFQEYLVGDHSVAPAWAWIAAGAGVISIAAASGGSGGSNHSGNGDKTGPKLTYDILDNQKIKITVDEASKITIVDASGKIIGSGQLNQAGGLEINLTRPLVDNEKITITAIDNAGNKTTETINVGDVTKPEVEINIVDNDTIQVNSNEPGSKVIIKNEAGQTIAEGIIGPDGKLIVDLNTPLNDGSKIIVDVIDAAGNQTEKVITVGDVTPPNISTTIQDATHIQVTSNEAGQVKITDSHGNVIGTGTITGNNTVDNIQLTRPLTDGEKITVTVTDGAGNPKAIEITAGDVTNPQFQSSHVDSTGTQLTLTYSETLDPLHPPVAGNFTVTVDGQVVPVTGVTVNGSTVVLTLGTPVTAGQAVTVGYTDPSAANDPNAIQDIAGNDAATLPATTVDNGSTVPGGDTTAPTFVSAALDTAGTSLTLTYSEALDSNNLPPLNSFVVTADGQVVPVTGVTVNGSTVVLTLGTPVTAGQAVTVGYTDPSAANDPNAIQDIAGNDAATLPATTVDNGSTVPGGDTTAPTFVSAALDTAGTSLTLTYSEALDSNNLPPLNSFVVTADGQVVPVTGVTVNGSTVVLTLGTPVTAGQAVQVGYTDPSAANDPNAIQDIAGNDAATLPATTVDNGSTVPGGDTTAPTFVSAALDTAGTSLTLTYSEALDSNNLPPLNSFVVTADGQVVPVTGVTVNGSTVVLTLGTPVTAGQAVQVGYTDPSAANDPNAIQDIAGNDAATLPATTVDNGSTVPGGDTTAPTFVSAALDTAGTLLTLTYSEALDSNNLPPLNSFVVTADGQVVPVTGVTVNGSTVVLTLGTPVTAGQAVQVGYTDPSAANDPNAIQDIAGNDAATLPATTVDNGSTVPGGDTTAPTFVSAALDTAGTLLTLTYSEALDSNNLPPLNSFVVTADGQVVPVTGVTVNGSTVVLTLGTPVTAGQAVQVGYTDPTAGNDPNAIQDIAGNDAVTLPPTSVTNGSVIPSDTTAPTFVNATVDPLGTTLTLNYNEALDPLNPPVAGDFAVTADGQVVAITGVLVVGSSVVLTLGAPVTLGQAVQVGYTDPTAGNDPNAIQDIAGNDAVTLPPTSVTNGSVIPSDTTAPTFVNATVDPLGTTLTLNYNEALDPLNPPVAGDFAVTADGQVVAITGVLVVGSSVVLTLGAPVTLGQAVQVGYTDPTAGNDPNAIQDIAGNDAVTLPPTSVTNGSVIPSDTTAPTFVNATVDPLGTTLTLNYNEALDPLNPPVAGDFAVTADGQVVAITGVLVVGSSVVLTLGAPVTLGQAVQVGYTDPTAGNDPNAIQDIAGNDAVTLPPTSVTNGSVIPSDTTAPTFVNATVDPLGTTLTLNYNEALDPLNPPVAGDFAVTADGQVVAITGVLVVGSSVVLTLGAPVTLGQAVQVGYTDPTAGNDPNAIQDIAGNDAVTLPPTSVTNGSVIPSDTTAPTFVNATVDPLGTTLTLNYNEALDPLNPPVAGDFAVTADGQVVAITGVLVVGSSVVLTLGAPVTLGQAVQVGYTDPTAGNDPNAIQDIAGNDAVTLPPTSVTNGSVIPSDTTAPTFVNATVDPLGTTLTLNYNEALDPLNPPVAGDFAVTADGQVVAITGVLVVGSSVVLTLGAPVTLGQAVQVGYTDPTAGNDPNAIQDIAGNDAVTLPPTSVTNGSVIPSDTTAPTFVNATVDPLGTTLTLNYNEALDPLNPPVAGDFAVTADGQVVAITGVLVVGSSVVLTLGAPVTLGQAVQVGYTDPTAGNDPNAIQDIAGNDAVTLPPTSVTNGSVIPSDTTAPTFVNATVDPLGTTLTLNYNEALDPLNPPVAGDFAVTADGQVVAITGVLVVGSSVVLTLGAPVTLGQAVQVGYTDPTAGNDPNAIQDIAGNDAVTLPPTSVTNGSVIPSDTTAPTFVNATVDPLGTTLTLNYNEALDPLNPPVAGDFAVTADGQVVAITGVLVVGSSVVLTLGAPVTLGQAVQVGYTDPTAGNDPNAIQDIAGNDAVTLPPTSVTNGSVIPSDTTAPTFVNATVDPLGTTLTLNYNEALDPLNPPVAGDFAVTADGQVVAITGVLVVGSSVVLTLGAPVTLGQAVQVGYTDPTAGNDPNAIQDIAGNDAVTLPPTSVTNGSVIPSDTTAPTFVNATVDPLGTTLTLNYNEALDPLNPPVAGDFAVTADGQVVAITGVLVVGSSVVLTLGAPVTLGQAVQVGYTDPTAGNDPNAIQDIAGNDAVTLPPTSVTNGSVIPSDTTAPTFVNATVDPLGTTLTLNYNEALDPLNPPVAGDFAVTADGQVVAITGVLVVGSSVVLTLGAPVTLGQAVQVGYTDPTAGNDPNAIQDIAGNDAVTLPPTSVTNGSVIPSDTTAPTFVNATVDPLGTTLTLNYNEALDPLNPPVAGDFAVTADGQVVAITGVLVVGSSVVLTLGAPVTLGQAVQVGYTDPTAGNDPNAIQDIAGNDAVTLPPTSVTNGSVIPSDTTAPTFVNATVDPLGTTLTLNYNEALDPLNPPVAGDFAVTADGQVVAITGVLVVGSSVVLTLGAPVTLGQAVQVGYTDPTAGNDPNAIQDIAGNDAVTLPPTSVTNGSVIPSDTTAPTFVNATVDPLGTTLTLNYNEALDPLNPPVAGDFAVTADGQVVAITGVLVVGSSVVLTLGAPVTLGQAVQVGYTDPTAGNDPNAIQDIAGNDAVTLPPTSVTNGSVIPSDTTAPTFVNATVDPLGTTLTLNYNEALDPLNPPVAGDFAVTADGQVVAITGVLVVGSSVVLTLGAPVTLGQAVQVGYTDPTAGNDPNAIQDIAGNDAVTLPPTSVTNGSVIPSDTTAPTFVNATVDPLGTTLTLNYNEALDPLNPPVAGDFAVTADGQVVAITGVLVVGSSVVLTLGAPVTLGQAVQVGYTDPTAGNDPNAIQDIAGNDAVTLPPTSVTNGSVIPSDTTAPTFVNATVDPLGTTLTLNYNEALDPLNPPVAGDFAVTADGQVVAITGVLVVGSSVVLTLGAPVTLGQAVQVGYTDPTAGNDPNAIQDIAGNDAVTLPPTSVTNGSVIPSDTTAPTFVNATVDPLGTTLTLNYNEALDPLNPPVAGDFAVTADGQVVAITSVLVVGSSVVLTLGAPVTLGQAVQVGYTDPTAGNDPNAIQDIAGNDAVTLPPTSVTNGSVIPSDTTAPTFVNATVDPLGTTLTLNYNEALDPLNPPVAGDFAVTADGQVVAITGVLVVGSSVVLTLGAPVTLGQAVQVGYTDPTAGNDPNAIQDIAGNDAVTLPPTSVTNGSVIPSDTTAPTFVNATVDPLGTTLTLNYNEALDPLNPPVAGDFAVTADGQVVAITSVLVVGSSVVLTLGAPVTLGQAVQVGYTDPTAGNDPNAIQDIAGNDAVTLPPTSVTNGSVIPSDTTAPTFVNATVDPLGTTLTLNYNEALDPLNPPVAGDFAVTADGQVVAITGVLVVGSSVVLTLGAPVTLGQAVQVGYTDPTAGNDPNAIQDIAGNDAVTLPPTSVTNGSVIPSDTTAPTFVNATVDPLGTTLTLNYNEALDPLNPPVAGDFAVTADGQVVAITGVLVVGSSVVLTLGAPVTLGQAVQVGYTDPTAGNDPNAIQDIAGNDAVTLPPTSVTNGSVIPSDTTAPTFVNATVDPLGTTLTLNYNEALDPLNPPVAGDFAVTADGQVVAITGVLVVGSSVVLTLGAPVTLGQAVQVGYTDPTAGNDPNAIQDIAGNDAVTLPPTSVTNGSVIPSDTTAPTFVNATVDPLGTTLTLNYNEALDPLNPPVAGDFAVTADGQVVAITGVLVVGSSVVLTLGAPVTLGQAVQVGYTDPTAGNDPNAIQDIAGNDAVTLPPTSVTNGSVIPSDTTAPTFVNATVDPLGTTLTLNYNEALDPLNPPVAGDFAVTADGQVVAITSVLVVGSSVVLTLGAPVTLGQAVQVGYTDPTAGNDPNAIQDIAGNDAVTLPPTSVTNGSIVIPPLNAVNDEFALNLGQEVRVNRTEVAGSDIAVVDILGNNATGLNFSIPQTPGSAGKGATGNISVTVSQQDLISVGEAVQIVIYQQTTNGPVEVARGTSQGGIVTVGGIGIIGVVNSNDSIKLDFTNLPEGDYTVAVQADDSALTTLLKDVAITDLGGEGEILGASNAAAIGAAINTVLGPLGAPVLALVNTILIPVNTLGLPLSSVVNQLLNVLPISVIDYIVDAAVAPLLSNLLTIYEKTNISVTGTEEVFANYAVTGNVFADNGNGQDVVGGGSITEIDGATVAQGSVTIQGEYGSLEINTLTGVFTYTVTAGETAVGKTEIFDYKLSNGATSDTAQIIINIAGTPADPGELTPPDYVDQVVARDDLATVKNYHESVGDDVGVHGRASQLLGVNLLGLNISLGNTVPFNFEVEENSTSSIHVNVSGSVVSAAIGGLIGALLGTADKFFNAVLERQYVDENGVIQKEHFIVEDAVKLTPPGLLGIIFNYSGQINLDNLPPGVYTIALQEKPTDSGLLQQILNLLDSTASAQLFGGVELTMQDQTNKYLGSSTIEGNVISSVDGADEVNTTTFVTKVANEVGDPAVTLSGANTVVVGAYGTLYISPNGHYKYVSNGDPADIGKVDTFTYTIRDFNGSEATANLNIRIDGDNSGVVWDNTNPENDVSLPAPIILDNAEHVAIGAVTNVVQIVSEANQGASFAVAGTLGGGGGTYVPTTFNVANTDSSHVVVKVNIPPLSVSLLPTIVLTIKDQNGTVVGTITGKPLLNALGSSITVDMPNLGPGTYTITASASGNIGLGFNATVSLAQDITHYNEIAPVTAAPIIGNMLTDDTYNPSYAKFSIDTGNGQFVEVGYNGVTVQGEYGSLFVKSDGSYVYTPSAGVIGRQEVFDYKLSVFGQDHTASLTVTVDAITTGDALRNTLISGEQNDTFTGNAGSDVLVYHVLESASASGGNGIDHWTDFHSGNVNTDTNADIIDISDLLIGFNSANITADLTASANYLKNYLGVRVDGNNVTLTLDRDGAGTTYTGKTDLLQLDNLAQSGAAFNGKTEDDILKLLLQNHQLVL